MKEDFLLEIFVKTNASSNFVEWDELSQKHVVSVQDPPVKGKANKRILKTLKAFFTTADSLNTIHVNTESTGKQRQYLRPPSAS